MIAFYELPQDHDGWRGHPKIDGLGLQPLEQQLQQQQEERLADEDVLLENSLSPMEIGGPTFCRTSEELRHDPAHWA